MSYVINKAPLEEGLTNTFNSHAQSYSYNSFDKPSHLRWNPNPTPISSSTTTNNNNNEPKKYAPKSMTNRYFSVENSIKEATPNLALTSDKVDKIADAKERSSDLVEQDTPQESDLFIKKRDYLIKKLTQSRNLPDSTAATTTTTTTTTTTEPSNESQALNSDLEATLSNQQDKETSSEKIELKAKTNTNTPSFQDDFIPLFSSSKQSTLTTNDNREECGVENEEIVIENYEHKDEDEEDIVEIAHVSCTIVDDTYDGKNIKIFCRAKLFLLENIE